MQKCGLVPVVAALGYYTRFLFALDQFTLNLVAR